MLIRDLNEDSVFTKAGEQRVKHRLAMPVRTAAEAGLAAV